MGQYFRINGDYNIKCKDGSTITLDPGTGGTVAIPANLTVGGTVTTVSSSQLEIDDRIITVNKGESGPGVSLIPGEGRFSGIEVDRGTYVDSTAVPKAAFVWNEENPPAHDAEDTLEDPTSGSGYWMIATGEVGSYGFRDSNLKLRRILTDSSTDSGDLTLVGTGSGVIKVGNRVPTAGTTYRQLVTDDNDVPNKDYVDYSILNNPTFQIRAPQNQDTRVIIADKEVTPNLAATPGSLAFYASQTGQLAGTESKVAVLVDNVLTTEFFTDRVEIFGLSIGNGTISQDGATNDNIYIKTNGTGRLQTNYALELENNPMTPAVVYGSHVIYSKPQSVGKSGVFFVNNENNRDELVSKNRAVLFSMIF